MKITTIGIDLAKNVFQVYGVDAHGKAALKKQIKREEMAVFLANLAPCLIGMEHAAARITGHASCRARVIRSS